MCVQLLVHMSGWWYGTHHWWVETWSWWAKQILVGQVNVCMWSFKSYDFCATFENTPVARNEGLGIQKEVWGFKNVSGVWNGVWSLKGGSGGFKTRAWVQKGVWGIEKGSWHSKTHLGFERRVLLRSLFFFSILSCLSYLLILSDIDHHLSWTRHFIRHWYHILILSRNCRHATTLHLPWFHCAAIDMHLPCAIHAFTSRSLHSHLHAITLRCTCLDHVLDMLLPWVLLLIYLATW